MKLNSLQEVSGKRRERADHRDQAPTKKRGREVNLQGREVAPEDSRSSKTQKTVSVACDRLTSTSPPPDPQRIRQLFKFVLMRHHLLSQHLLSYFVSGKTLKALSQVDQECHAYFSSEEKKLELLQRFPQLPLRSCGFPTPHLALEFLRNHRARITHIDLSCYRHNVTAEQISSIIQEFPNLRSLSTWSSQLTDASLANISNLKHLKHLELKACDKLTDVGMAHVAKLSQLSTLKLTCSSRLTDTGMQHISTMKNLRKLSLCYCWKVTPKGFESLSQLKELQILEFNTSLQMTNKALVHIGKMTNLRRLSLEGTPLINAEGFRHLSGLRQLEQLSLRSCNQLTDEDIEELTEFKKLRMINLGFCSQLTDKSLQMLSYLPELKKIVVDSCDNFTDKGLTYLEELDELTHLNIYGSKFNPEGYQTLSRFTKLRYLRIMHTWKVTKQQVEALTAALPYCEFAR